MIKSRCTNHGTLIPQYRVVVDPRLFPKCEHCQQRLSPSAFRPNEWVCINLECTASGDRVYIAFAPLFMKTAACGCGVNGECTDHTQLRAELESFVRRGYA